MTHNQKVWWWGTAAGADLDANVVMRGGDRRVTGAPLTIRNRGPEMTSAGPNGPAGHGFGRFGTGLEPDLDPGVEAVQVEVRVVGHVPRDERVRGRPGVQRADRDEVR